MSLARPVISTLPSVKYDTAACTVLLQADLYFFFHFFDVSIPFFATFLSFSGSAPPIKSITAIGLFLWYTYGDCHGYSKERGSMLNIRARRASYILKPRS